MNNLSVANSWGAEGLDAHKSSDGGRSSNRRWVPRPTSTDASEALATNDAAAADNIDVKTTVECG